jgi:membrane protein YqaA with SNARE-associated domain
MSQSEKSTQDSRVAAFPAASAKESFTSLTRNPFKRLYAWVLSLSEKKSGAWALFILAFAESSFFPIPPDVLLIALALGTRKKAFKFALICTIGSVLGGAFGYYLGYALYEPVAKPLISFLGAEEKFQTVRKCYHQYDVLAVAAAALTPIPYKLFTIGGGLCRINFPLFVLVSFIFRGLRFFAVSALIYKFGPPVKSFIDKYFNRLTLIFFALLLAGFLFIKYLWGR